MAQDKLSELREWYEGKVWTAIHWYTNPSGPIDEWKKTLPCLMAHPQVRQKTKLAAALCFKENVIVFDDAFLRDSPLGKKRQALVHCLAHRIKGQPEAHGKEWQDAYPTLCKRLDLEEPDVNDEISNDRYLRQDCDKYIQGKLEDLVKTKTPRSLGVRADRA